MLRGSWASWSSSARPIKQGHGDLDDLAISGYCILHVGNGKVDSIDCLGDMGIPWGNIMVILRLYWDNEK